MAKINVNEIPQIEIQLHGRYLLKVVEKYFKDPAVQKDYKKWLKEYKKRKKTA